MKSKAFWRNFGMLLLVILAANMVKSMFFSPPSSEQNIAISGFQFVLPVGWDIPSKSDLQKVSAKVEAMSPTTKMLFMASQGRERGAHVFFYVLEESLGTPVPAEQFNNASDVLVALMCAGEKDGLAQGYAMLECERKPYKAQKALRTTYAMPAEGKQGYTYLFFRGDAAFKLSFLAPSGNEGIKADMEKIAGSVK